MRHLANPGFRIRRDPKRIWPCPYDGIPVSFRSLMPVSIRHRRGSDRFAGALLAGALAMGSALAPLEIGLRAEGSPVPSDAVSKVAPGLRDAPGRSAQEESRRNKADSRLRRLREGHAAGTLTRTEERQWERLEAQARSGPGRKAEASQPKPR